MKTRDYNCRICLEINWLIYKVFTIGYYEDGGYFITDLIDLDNKYYKANKIRCTSIPAGTSVPFEENSENSYSIKLRKPKISHHIDGKAHISWDGIISWYLNGEPKWLSVLSGNLNNLNDWGPMFVFHIWKMALEKFTQISKDILEKENKKNYAVLHSEYSVDIRKYKSEEFGYLIEWYYVPKEAFIKAKRNIINIQHPLYGLTPLYCLFSPPQCPYVFWIACIKDHKCDERIFSFTGAPWIIQNDDSWDIIGITLTEEELNFKSLNLE